MSYYDKVTTQGEAVRGEDGLVQCGDSHYSVYGHRSRPTVRPAATDAWYEGDYKALVFTCKRHSGTIKAAITKGSYSGRNVEAVESFGISLAEAAADPATVIAVIRAKVAAGRVKALQLMADRELAYRRDGWQKHRDAYMHDTDVEFSPFEKPDEFGRVYVGLAFGPAGRTTYIKVSPHDLRKLVTHAAWWADEAERLTLEQVKP